MSQLQQNAAFVEKYYLTLHILFTTIEKDLNFIHEYLSDKTIPMHEFLHYLAPQKT